MTVRRSDDTGPRDHRPLPSADTERGRDQLRAVADGRYFPADVRAEARERLAEWLRIQQTPAPIMRPAVVHFCCECQPSGARQPVTFCGVEAEGVRLTLAERRRAEPVPPPGRTACPDCVEASAAACQQCGACPWCDVEEGPGVAGHG